MSENTSAAPTGEHFRSGLAMLRQAYAYAKQSDADLWDFALEIDKLYDVGLTVSDLRWLVSKDYTQHGQETTDLGDAHRAFRPSDGLNFTETTCFVLTAQGALFAEKVLNESAATD